MKTVQVQLRLTPQVRTAAQARAVAETRTLSGWIKALVHRELGMDGASAAEELPEDVRDHVTPVPAAAPAPPAKKKKASVRCSKHKRLNCKNCVPGT